MEQPNKFTCSCCGQILEEWPALTFIAPDNYAALSNTEKERRGELDTDFCIIRHDDGEVDRFIRCTLTQMVTDACQDLDYGLWVSLSEKSFQDYADRFGDETQEGGVQYFGWLCNDIPGYEFEAGIPTTVVTKADNCRPEIFPHKEFDHPFVYDYYNGITEEEAKRRIRRMLASIAATPPVIASRKPWWKIW